MVQEPESNTRAADEDGQPDADASEGGADEAGADEAGADEAGADAGTGADAARKLKSGEPIPADSPCQDGSERPYPPCFYIL
ncbi:hypothetical protein [Chondromyces apiculatus]|uniref:Uncharacterized protein n=1 Tax=Chondromyces apiculatus DSM 436 TaxID=1192034 RepID=A0A017TIF8_9BACT|nr:hypothetical protein [Chondromyces apiculatus]EYF08625.1 Hypothetical protein CAP_4155 [Chondromyces apiculatus DSM 436]